jgi:hypothetical protein
MPDACRSWFPHMLSLLAKMIGLGASTFLTDQPEFKMALKHILIKPKDGFTILTPEILTHLRSTATALAYHAVRTKPSLMFGAYFLQSLTANPNATAAIELHNALIDRANNALTTFILYNADVFKFNAPHRLLVFADSGFQSRAVTKCPTHIGYIIFLAPAEGKYSRYDSDTPVLPIFWRAQQLVTPNSVPYGEACAALAAYRHAELLADSLQSMAVVKNRPFIDLYVDNSSVFYAVTSYTTTKDRKPIHDQEHRLVF